MIDLEIRLAPITGPFAWRGDEIEGLNDWMYHLRPHELDELERVGARFLSDDPDLRTVVAAQYPLPICAPSVAHWGAQMDAGRGFVLVRGLRSEAYTDALSAAIFFVIGLHLGEPMRQNEVGDAIQHVIATSDKPITDPTASSLRIRDRLNFHSDSSDVVSLFCLRPAKSGGASSLVSSATLYNEVLARRPDLAPLLFQTWHFDWRRQDPDAPANTYASPMMSLVDGVFSAYIGTRIVRTAQAYPEVPRLSADQVELLDLLDAICIEPGVALHMDFRPGDMQWLLNYAALHSRTAFEDYPEPERRRHLMRLWLKRDVDRPLVPAFGRHVVQGREQGRNGEVPPEIAKFRIAQASVPRLDWGL